MDEWLNSLTLRFSEVRESFPPACSRERSPQRVGKTILHGAAEGSIWNATWSRRCDPHPMWNVLFLSFLLRKTVP